MDSATGDYTYTPAGDGADGVPTSTVVVQVSDGVNGAGKSNLATLTFVGYTIGLESQEGEGDDTAADGDENFSNPTVPKVADSNAGTAFPSQTLNGTLTAASGSTFHLVAEDPGNPAASSHSVTLDADTGAYIYHAPSTLAGLNPIGDWFTYYVTDSDGNKSNYATVFVTLQPVKAALTWSDQPAGSDPSYSETLNVNNDIENTDDIPDNTEAALVPGDTDVRELNLNVSTPLPNGSNVTLSGGGDNVRVWEDDGAGTNTYTQVLGSGGGSSRTWTVDSMAGTSYPVTVLVEGNSAGDFQFDLKVTLPTTASEIPGAQPASAPATTSATTQGSVKEAIKSTTAIFFDTYSPEMIGLSAPPGWTANRAIDPSPNSPARRASTNPADQFAGLTERIFPENTSPSDPFSSDRSKVILYANALRDGKPAAGEKVYFRVIDPPHASWDTSTLPAGITLDNRHPDGTFGDAPIDLEAVSDASGLASVVLTLPSVQPGNNFMFYAGMNKDDLAKVEFGKTPPAGIAQSQKELVVWRTLHVERDHMAAPPAGTPQLPAPYQLPTAAVPDMPISLMQSEYKRASIDVVDDAANNTNPTVPWDDGLATVSGKLLADVVTRPARDIANTADYWSLRLITMFASNDPNVFGETQYRDSTSVVFDGSASAEWKSLTDSFKHAPKGAQVQPVPLATFETRDALHESLHTMMKLRHSTNDPADNGIMNGEIVWTATADKVAMSDLQLSRARSLVKPGG